MFFASFLTGIGYLLLIVLIILYVIIGFVVASLSVDEVICRCPMLLLSNLIFAAVLVVFWPVFFIGVYIMDKLFGDKEFRNN